MILSRQLEESRSGDASGEEASAFHVDEGVVGAVNNQGWDVDRRQDIADVGLGGHLHHRHCGCRTCAQSLEAAPPLLQGGIVSTRRRPRRQAEAAAPSPIRVFEKGL